MDEFTACGLVTKGESKGSQESPGHLFINSAILVKLSCYFKIVSRIATW